MHTLALPKRLIIAITGASGAVYGIKMLEILQSLKIETHLIISASANITISTETKIKPIDLKNKASFFYNNSDIAAKIASGSFHTDGMIVAPCSMKTLSAIANGYEDGLISRAAAVCIKERRKLTLMVRETPLNSIQLENMLKLSNVGVNICPPVPAFYINPETVDDIVKHSVIRVLDLYGMDMTYDKRWQ